MLEVRNPIHLNGFLIQILEERSCNFFLMFSGIKKKKKSEVMYAVNVGVFGLLLMTS